MRDDRVTIAYFGGAAVKITTAKGKHVLIDPYITKNKLCRKGLEYFYDADLILVSHGAFDHMGDTVEIMKNSQAVLVCGSDVASYCLQMGIPKERIKTTTYGDQKEFDGILIKAVDAKHSSKVLSEEGTVLYYGMPMGFVVSTENGIRIYHAGDTSLFSDLKLIGMLYRPNIAMIGITSVVEGLPAEMNPREAALATQWLAPDIVLPMHYPPGSDKPREFCEAVKIVAPNVETALVEPNSQVVYSKYQLEVG